MNRLSFERTKRRTHLRLTLEHLESRRLMAGLNVLVFADNDGSRTLGTAADSPAANRLVYVDLNRSGRFEDGEPLSVSGADGLAKFPNLPAGDYFVALAGGNPAQLQTTSVTSDPLGQLVATADTQTLISSSDLRHVWSVSSSGRVTAVGTADSQLFGAAAPLELGGPVLGSTQGRPTDSREAIAWALVDRGGERPALLRLDLAAGKASEVAVQNLPPSNRIAGIASMGEEVVLKLDGPGGSAAAKLQLSETSAAIGDLTPVPRGTLVSSPAANRLAIVGAGNERAISSVRFTESGAALVETATAGGALQNAQFLSDGKTIVAARTDGGLEVFATDNELRSVAYLAEAGGAIAVSQADGRVITGNATQPGQLIVWDSASWSPVSRIALAATSFAKSDSSLQSAAPLRALAVDQFGQRVLAATASSVFGAGLANPAPLPVSVAAGNRTSQASLGVRLIGQPTPLPSRVEIAKSLDEDSRLSVDLSSIPALAALGASNFMYAPSVNPQSGTLQVTPTGRLSYQPPANGSGTDKAELKLFDGINTTTVALTLNVNPVNDPPSAFTIDARSISEAATAGTSAGYTTVFDVDADASYLITTDDPRFTVVDGELRRTEFGELDFESEPIVALHVTATDASNPSFVLSELVSIPIADSNDGPTSFSFYFSTIVCENSSDFEIGNFSIDDPDAHGPYAITLSDNRFEVVDGFLRIKADQPLDYEQEHRIELVVTVSDPTAEINKQPVSGTITIEVQDMNDAPDDLWVDPASVMPHQPGAYVGHIYVSDEDFYDDYVFSVSDPRFVVEGNTLRLRDGESVDRTASTTVPVIVTATDADGNVLSKTITVEVINDAPFQNPNNPLDVDNDGATYPRDVLILIDLLNRKGPHAIDPLGSAGEGDDPDQQFFIDVNGDGYFSPLDALIIINHLNKRSLTGDGEGEAAPAIESRPLAPASRLASFSSDPTTFEPLAADDAGLACPPYSPESSEAGLAPPLAWSVSDDSREALASDLDIELESLLEQLSRERLR